MAELSSNLIRSASLRKRCGRSHAPFACGWYGVVNLNRTFVRSCNVLTAPLNSVPLSVNTFAGKPHTLQICSYTASATVSACLFGIGVHFKYRVNRSTTVRMNRFPFLVVFNGPKRSIATMCMGLLELNDFKNARFLLLVLAFTHRLHWNFWHIVHNPCQKKFRLILAANLVASET